MLIRGTNGYDWGILRTSWINFVRGRNAGKLKADLFVINGKDSYWRTIDQADTYGEIFQWSNVNRSSGMVDIKRGNITFSDQVTDVGEFIALGCAIAISFVLCQPRPPPPKDEQPYPEPSSNRVYHLDSMELIVAAGLYSSQLPRWYHTKYDVDGLFFQIHPKYLDHHKGTSEAGFDYDFDVDSKYKDIFVDDTDNDCHSGMWVI